MKNSKIFSVVILIFFSYNSFSQSTLETVRKSVKVKNEITLIVKDKDSIDYYIDSRNTGQKTTEKSLESIDYFQVKSKEFRVYVNFVNPLKYRLSASNKSLDDELFKATDDYITTAIDFLSNIRKGLSARKYRSNASGNALPNSAETKLEAQLGEMYIIVDTPSLFKNAAGNDTGLFKAMKNLDFVELQEEISNDYNTAFSALTKIDTIDLIQSVIDSNEKLFATHDVDLASLDNRFNLLLVEMKSTTYANTELENYVNYKINQVGIDIKDFKNTHKELKEKYASIKKLFESIVKRKHSDDDTKFLLKKVKDLKNSKRNELNITLEEIEFDSKEKKVTIKNKKSFLLNVRKYSALVPVVSSGVIYTNLSFAQFGTDTDDNGNTIVSQADDKTNELTLGAYLNLYLNNKWNLPLFLQFGVGPSKEKPLFFLGGGLEIGNRINISSGAVFTWFPELNDLSIGQQVNGTSDIDNDISFKFDTKPKFYIGINFDITKK